MEGLRSRAEAKALTLERAGIPFLQKPEEGKRESAKINIKEKRRKLEKLGPYGLRFLGHLLRDGGIWREKETGAGSNKRCGQTRMRSNIQLSTTSQITKRG